MKDRSEPKFYPLVNADAKGKYKYAMIPTNNEKQISADGEPYLAEVVSHVFRVRGDVGNSIILCPYCGSNTKNIAPGRKPLLVCQKCK